jgi:hypothetical protein
VDQKCRGRSPLDNGKCACESEYFTDFILIASRISLVRAEFLVIGTVRCEGYCRGKLLSPERRRSAVEHARQRHELSERHARRLVKQWRGTQRYGSFTEGPASSDLPM